MTKNCVFLLAICALAAPASSFAMAKKIGSQFPTSERWGVAINALLNGVNLADLGQVQGGPYIVSNKGGDQVVLTTIGDGGCHLLSKPLSELELMTPATLQKISCNQGATLRQTAVLHSVPEFSALSEKGKAILLSLSEITWRASREYQSVESDRKQEFSQEFSFWLNPELTEVETASDAVAFTHAATCRRSQWQQLSIRVAAILEHSLPDGSTQFLIWGGGPPQEPWMNPIDFQTADQNKMRLAVVDPMLINAAGPVSLTPGEKICVGASCRSVSEVAFTRNVSFQFMVLHFDPSKPAQMGLELNQVDARTPSLSFQFQKKGN